MKKSYLLILGLSVGVTSFAQQKLVAKKPAVQGLTKDVTSVKPASHVITKAPGDVIYSETFNGSMSNWTTMDVDGAIWQFDTDGPDGVFSSATNSDIITSTTAANGFMIFDADLSNPVPPYVDRIGSLVSPVIDVSAYAGTGLSIKFQHAYRTCCSASFIPKLEVSTDGFATFTSYDVTAPGIGVNDFSGTVVKELNISSFLASAVGLQNFQMRFNFDGISGGSSHYFWEVDDIQIIEPFDYSLSALLDYWGTVGFWGVKLPYNQVPYNQVAPIDYSLLVENRGGQTQTDITLSAVIPEGPFNATSVQFTIASGTVDTLDLGTTFTPDGTNTTYNPVFTVASSNIDADPSDNVYNGMPVIVNDSVYARDMGAADGGTYNQGQGYEAGNIFDMFNDGLVKTVTFRVNSTSNAGAQVYARIYDLDPLSRDFRFLVETDLHTVTAGELGTLITLPLQSQTTLLKDSSYLLVAGSYGDGGATDDFIVGTSGTSEPQTSYYFDMTDQTWYYTTSTPMVRLNLFREVGLTEAEAFTSLNVYPNPAAHELQVDFSLKNQTPVSVNVKDMTGKTVYQAELGQKAAGSHELKLNTTSFANGMYVLSFTTTSGVSTQKLVIRK